MKRPTKAATAPNKRVRGSQAADASEGLITDEAAATAVKVAYATITNYGEYSNHPQFLQADNLDLVEDQYKEAGYDVPAHLSGQRTNIKKKEHVVLVARKGRKQGGEAVALAHPTHTVVSIGSSCWHALQLLAIQVGPPVGLC